MNGLVKLEVCEPFITAPATHWQIHKAFLGSLGGRSIT